MEFLNFCTSDRIVVELRVKKLRQSRTPHRFEATEKRYGCSDCFCSGLYRNLLAGYGSVIEGARDTARALARPAISILLHKWRVDFLLADIVEPIY